MASIVNAATVAGADNQAAGVTVTVNAGDIAIGNWNSCYADIYSYNRAAESGAGNDETRQRGERTDQHLPGKGYRIHERECDRGRHSATEPELVSWPQGTWMRRSGFRSSSLIPASAAGARFSLLPMFPEMLKPALAGKPLTISPASANTMRSIVDGMINGTYMPPASCKRARHSLNFTNGNMASVWANLVTLWQTKVAQNGAWDANVPVYAGSDCSPSREPKQSSDLPPCGSTMLGGLAMRITPPTVAAQIRRPAVCPGWFNATCLRGWVEVAEVPLERSEPFLASLNNAYDSGGTHACLDSSQSR